MKFWVFGENKEYPQPHTLIWSVWVYMLHKIQYKTFSFISAITDAVFALCNNPPVS